MSSDIDPIAAMQRANQAFHEQLLETAALKCGTAYFSAEYGAIANQVREVTLPADCSMDQAFAEVQSFFEQLGHPCRSWSPALDQSTRQIGSFLSEKGYVTRPKITMALRPWPELPARPPIRVVPGRAVRQELRRLLAQDPGRGSLKLRELSTDMFMARMDDPRLDVFAAMSDTGPLGHACLMQVGPIAAIYDLYVQESHRRQGCGLALMHDIITTCRRLELRTVVLEVGKNNIEAFRLYERCGFQHVATSVDFFAPPESPS